MALPDESPVAARGREAPSAPPLPAAPRERGVDEALERLLVEVGKETQPQPLRVYGELRGLVAIVSGGATGIGRATALALAQLGVHIAFNYLEGDERVLEEAERTEQELRQLEVNVLRRACDVRDPVAVSAFVQETVERLGGLHILVNNAGISRDRALWRMTDEEWREVLDTNLTGAFNLIRAVAPILRAQQYGKIVNISSIHGLRSEFGLANYAASKAGLLGLTRSQWTEYEPGYDRRNGA